MNVDIENWENELEIAALKSFRDSIDNSLQEYLHSSIEMLLTLMESCPEHFSTEQKVNAISQLITKSLKWRYEYELHMQYAKPKGVC